MYLENAATASSAGPALPQLCQGGVNIFVKAVLYLLWCGKGACWPSKRRWPCRPRWLNAVEDEKSLRWWARRVEHPRSSRRRDANATLPLHSAPDKQATSARCTKPGNTGKWSWIVKPNGKWKEIWNIDDWRLASAIWATTYGPVRNQAQLSLHTVQPQLKETINVFITYLLFFSLKKNTPWDISSWILKHVWSKTALPISG